MDHPGSRSMACPAPDPGRWDWGFTLAPELFKMADVVAILVAVLVAILDRSEKHSIGRLEPNWHYVCFNKVLRQIYHKVASSSPGRGDI